MVGNNKLNRGNRSNYVKILLEEVNNINNSVINVDELKKILSDKKSWFNLTKELNIM
jgi:hypothetical protein